MIKPNNAAAASIPTRIFFINKASLCYLCCSIPKRIMHPSGLNSSFKKLCRAVCFVFHFTL
ncbi:hypothetical protein HMPREF9554_01522 [Treponema phagedenis F0421]|nr:hypothetical protein HMPREF9554_01522 [Treponema phagedenis F0421]